MVTVDFTAKNLEEDYILTWAPVLKPI
jgi:hypothetical protein